MAHAIRADRPHRASGELALHVLEVMEAFETSSDKGAHVDIATRPERPAPMLPTSLVRRSSQPESERTENDECAKH